MTKSRIVALRFVAAFLLSLSPLALAAGQIWTVGNAQIFGLSADGSVAVAQLPGLPDQVGRWTAATGMQTLALPTPSAFTGSVGWIPSGISQDGQTIIGNVIRSQTPVLQAPRKWTMAAGGTLIQNVTSSSQNSDDYTVSPDGSVIYGYTNGATTQAMEWINGGSATSQPAPSGAITRGVSGNGSVFYGEIFPPTSPNGTVIWGSTSAGTFMPTTPGYSNYVDAINYDGTVLAGVISQTSGPGYSMPIVWNVGAGVTQIPEPPSTPSGFIIESSHQWRRYDGWRRNDIA
jgi:hypothetical protein